MRVSLHTDTRAISVKEILGDGASGTHPDAEGAEATPEPESGAQAEGTRGGRPSRTPGAHPGRGYSQAEAFALGVPTRYLLGAKHARTLEGRYTAELRATCKLLSEGIYPIIYV